MCQNRNKRWYKLHFVCPQCGYSKKSNSRDAPEVTKCERCQSAMGEVSYDVEMPRLSSKKHRQMMRLLKTGKATLCKPHGCGCQANRGNTQPKRWIATSEKKTIKYFAPIPTYEKYYGKKTSMD